MSINNNDNNAEKENKIKEEKNIDENKEIKEKKLNEKVDKIILAYGINDITAVAAGNVSSCQVIYALNKAIDKLHQIVPNAEIIYILSSDNSSVLRDICNLQLEYLSYDYLKNYCDFIDKISFQTKWMDAYSEFQRYISRTFSDKLAYMINDSDFMWKYLDSDCIHPNDEGYKKIAENIVNSNII